MASWPWASHRSRRALEVLDAVGGEGEVVDPRLEPEPGRDGGVLAAHAVVVELPEGDEAVAAGAVEDVLGPAARGVGRCDDGLDQLEAAGLGVEAVRRPQVTAGERDVVEPHVS